MPKDLIIKALQKASGEVNVHLETPAESSHGDYSSNVALQAGGNSRENAKQLVAKLQKDKNLKMVVENIEIAGSGFVNFWLKDDVLIDNLREIDDQKEKYGESAENKGKLAIVEYSSPNIAKPFTIGHLRSTIIGDAVANLLEATGWKVMRDNHLGDWGTQFGKLIYAIKTWGNETAIRNSKNPIKDLVDLYVRFHKEAEKDEKLPEEGRKWFKKLEDGDKEARRIWKECIDWSFKEFDRIYKILDVKFSKEFESGRGLGESFFEDKMGVVISELKKKGFLKEGEKGAKLVFFDKDKYPPAMILKKDGATLYHTRDLATDKYRLVKYKPDLVINEVGSEQTLYFQQLYEIERLLGWYKDGQRVHIGHSLFRFKEGKMSTRKGNVIWLEEVLGEAVKKARSLGSKNKKLATQVGVGALKYNDLKRDPKTEIVFDWDEILSMQGNSGPYLQYTYARTQSVLKKAKKASDKMSVGKINDAELGVMRTIIHFPEIVVEAAERFAPNLICSYLYDLAQRYNSFYNEHKIVGGENEALRIDMTRATGQVLKNGLNLLGITAPERM